MCIKNPIINTYVLCIYEICLYICEKMICSFGAPLLFEQPPFLPLLLRAATHLSRPAADCPLLCINLAAIQRTKIDVNQISSGLKWFTMFMINHK